VKEADLQRRIQAEIKRIGGKVIKIHGNAYSVAGTPDLIGSLDSRPFAIEVKLPGEKPTTKQTYELAQWAAQGWATGIAHSIDEALRLVGASGGVCGG
jgi:hypothetical protein